MDFAITFDMVVIFVSIFFAASWLKSALTRDNKGSEPAEEESTDEGGSKMVTDDNSDDEPNVCLVSIDGKIQRGSFKCPDKDCGWEGDIDEVQETLIHPIKADASNGALIKEYKEDEEGNEVAANPILTRLLTCPNCDRIVSFVEKK